MISRPDLLDRRSPAGLEVFQLTHEAIPSCHIYMEAQIFTPDSKRFVMHRSAHPHGSNRHDPAHRYLLYNAESPGDQPVPLTDELGPTAPSISPDGKWFYYFQDQTELNAGRLSLKRVRLDGTDRETILVLDTPLPGAKAKISMIYPLSTISSDSKRIATSGFFGDGKTNLAPWGMIVCDIEKATADLVLAGPSWCNVHPQYCRSLDPIASHDIMVQQNHDNVCDPDGNIRILCGGRSKGAAGADIHVIRDDGSNFRNLPWGRDGLEYCQGHQCWRGRGTSAISTCGLPDQIVTTTAADGSTEKTSTEQIVEGVAAPFDGHVGLRTTGARRNVLSRTFEQPRFFHFATDIAGKRFVTDCHPHRDRGCSLYIAEFGREMQDPLDHWVYLLDTRTAFWKSMHSHPFLSPDGKCAFFNSDESGVLQGYMIRGLA
ncbi:MAG: PD40 domain-containing protein [Phycisphaeraceae bacterium]|nr:PD40 domain-containing protein [Phycisphaeraceae bacterium]